MGNYAFEYYAADAVFPTEGQVADGVVYGATGSDLTGTLSVSGGSGDATLAKQEEILAAIAAIESAAVTVVPLTGVVESRVNGTTIKVFTGETLTVSIAVIDATGASVAVSALSLSIVIEGRLMADVVTIANGSITKTGSTISFAVPIGVSGTEGDYQWSLRKTTDNSVLMQGPFIVRYAAQVDT